jgi:hypothetical protein
MSEPIRPVDDPAVRRKRAVRTALVAGGIALLIYAAFILSGIVAK